MRALEKLVDPKHFGSDFGEGGGQSQFNRGSMNFVLAFARGQSPAEVSERVAQVIKIATSQDASFCHIVGALVIIVFGALPQSAYQVGSRASLVLALRDRLGSDVKIVHGAAEGHYGVFGGNGQMSYTFLVPHFDKALGVLSGLEFGQSKEFQSSEKE